MSMGGRQKCQCKQARVLWRTQGKRIYHVHVRFWKKGEMLNMGHAGCVVFLRVAGETIGAGEGGQSVGVAKFGTLDAMRSES